VSEAPSQPPPQEDAFSLLLVVEDELTANRLIEVLSRPEGTAFAITRVRQVEEALLELHGTASRYDAMLIDLSVHEADADLYPALKQDVPPS
jgi:CheY-like chemotaxis protein